MRDIGIENVENTENTQKYMLESIIEYDMKVRTYVHDKGVFPVFGT